MINKRVVPAAGVARWIQVCSKIQLVDLFAYHAYVVQPDAATHIIIIIIKFRDMTNCDNELRQFLIDFGYPLDVPESEVILRLKRVMGPERYRQYNSLASGESLNHLRTKQEADLVARFQSEAICDIYHHISDTVIRVAEPVNRILDLGCYSGALCAWLAENLPNNDIVGVDQLGAVVEDAQSAAKGKYNLMLWEYSQEPPEKLGKFDILTCSLGMYFEERTESFGVDLRRLEENPQYVRCKREAAEYGHEWSKVAESAARLVSVLRIAGIEHFLSFCDGMASAGWNLQCELSSTVTSGRQKFPLLVFRRAAKSPFDSLQAAGWWATHYPLPPMADELEGENAAIRYLSAIRHDSEVLELVEVPSDPPSIIEFGTANEAAYVLLRAADGQTATMQWEEDVSDQEIHEWIGFKLGLEQ